MSEIKAEEAAERLRLRCIDPLWKSNTVDCEDLRELLVERESLLKYKEAFEAMVEHSWAVVVHDKFWTAVELTEVYQFQRLDVGSTPLEAVMMAKKAPEAKS